MGKKIDKDEAALHETLQLHHLKGGFGEQSDIDVIQLEPAPETKAKPNKSQPAEVENAEAQSN